MTTHALPFPVPFPSLRSFATREEDQDRSARSARRPEDAEERAWIHAAQGGDTDAFRRLVDRYRTLVVELAYRIVRSREEAEEAAQDAFVRAWRALPAFRHESRFSTWLVRIATRRALDVVGAAQRRRSREGATDPAELELAAAPGQGLEGPELRRLWRILGDLDPSPRAAVSLYYLGGRRVDEVAAILDMPEGTVKTLLYRARAELRRTWMRETRREERSGLPRL